MPTALRNTLLFATLWLATHWFAWYYFDLNIDFDKALWEAASGGLLGGAISLLPDGSKNWLRRLFSDTFGSPITTTMLLGCAAVFLCIALAFSKVVIRLPGEASIATVNGEVFNGATNRLSPLVVFRPAFSKIDVQVSDVKKSARSIPFLKSRIVFSEQELNTHLPLYKEAQDDLLLTFFQYFEGNFLVEANSIFATPPGRQFKELNQIYPILRRCFVDVDLNNRNDVAIETYSGDYAQSMWTPLLKSCTSYLHRQYDVAAKQLDPLPSSSLPEFEATYSFFRGVNRLKLFGIEAGSGVGASALADLAIADFDASYRLCAARSRIFFKIAQQSSLIFKGIANVYLSRLDNALEVFKAASEGSYPGLKSRAYNDIGYVHMIRGDLHAAEIAFNQALSVDGQGGFPTARVNLAYVKMALGDFAAAKSIFQSAANDPLVQKESLGATRLAKAGLAHLSMLTNPKDPSAYDGVMDALGLYKFEDVQNNSLRLAKIHRALAANLYTGKDYYGLEVFAMAMDAYAYFEAESAFAQDGNTDANSVKIEATGDFVRLKAIVNPSWFANRIDGGFFAPIYKLLDGPPLIASEGR